MKFYYIQLVNKISQVRYPIKISDMRFATVQPPAALRSKPNSILMGYRSLSDKHISNLKKPETGNFKQDQYKVKGKAIKGIYTNLVSRYSRSSSAISFSKPL